MMNVPIIWLVVPCYNETEVIDNTADILKKKFISLISEKKISEDSKILFVDDGSNDGTWLKIKELGGQSIFEGLKLSKNEGHQIALIAGYNAAHRYADAVVSIDADLQQDIDAIEEFINKYISGCEIVYGIRNSRDTDSFFKRITAEMFYKLMTWLGGEAKRNSADYRLLSSRAIDALLQYEESNVFIRGLIPTLGFKTGEVYFDVKERTLGVSKYSLKKMMSLALDGITSFSIKPVRVITGLGLLVMFVSILMILYSLIVHVIGQPVSGWTSLNISIWLLSGLQLFSIGVIGEYVGRTYMETKKRPRYFIECDTTQNIKDKE